MMRRQDYIISEADITVWKKVDLSILMRKYVKIYIPIAQIILCFLKIHLDIAKSFLQIIFVNSDQMTGEHIRRHYLYQR